MEPFALRTARLTLRRLGPEDAEMMFALNGDPEVMRHLPDPPFASVEAARAFLEGYQAVYREDGFARWAVVEEATGETLGWSGLRRLPDRDVDVGYRLLRRAWGRGFATESARASLAYGFEQLGLDRIVARAETANGASVRVLEKLGLRLERRETAEGKETSYFAIARADWDAARGA